MKDPYDLKEFERVKKTKLRRFKMITLTIIAISVFCVIIGFLINMNFVARKFGGDITINLQKNEKLVNVTWKYSNIWILTRPMRDGEEAEVYNFREDSNFGIFEGTVTLIESKTNN